MYITHDHIDEIKCIICGGTVPYFEINDDQICTSCQSDTN